MSERITIKNLRAAVEALNDTFDQPAEPYRKTRDGYKAVPGVFVLDCAYGGYRVERLVSGGGGVTEVTGRGTARECYWEIQAMLVAARMMKQHVTPRYWYRTDDGEFGIVTLRRRYKTDCATKRAIERKTGQNVESFREYG